MQLAVIDKVRFQSGDILRNQKRPAQDDLSSRCEIASNDTRNFRRLPNLVIVLCNRGRNPDNIRFLKSILTFQPWPLTSKDRERYQLMASAIPVIVLVAPGPGHNGKSDFPGRLSIAFRFRHALLMAAYEYDGCLQN